MDIFKTCFQCNGDGDVLIEFYDIHNVKHLIDHDCPVCIGTGYLSLTQIVDYNKDHSRCIEWAKLKGYGDVDLSCFDEEEGCDCEQKNCS